MMQLMDDDDNEIDAKSPPLGDKAQTSNDVYSEQKSPAADAPYGLKNVRTSTEEKGNLLENQQIGSDNLNGESDDGT